MITDLDEVNIFLNKVFAMNNVLLINTSFRKNHKSKYSDFGPPMGLLTIASSLKEHQYTVELIDPQTDSDYLIRLSAALMKQQLFVGMSTYLVKI